MTYCNGNNSPGLICCLLCAYLISLPVFFVEIRGVLAGVIIFVPYPRLPFCALRYGVRILAGARDFSVLQIV
jgi:hypothetical protein